MPAGTAIAFRAAFLSTILLSAAAGADEITFFAWSDQHVSVNGDAEHLRSAVEGMNQLPGRPDPDGQLVAAPAFILGCGDATNWPSRAAGRSYAAACAKLRFPTHDLLGNHDEGEPTFGDKYPSLIPAAIAVAILAAAGSAWLAIRRGVRWMLAPLVLAITSAVFASHWIYNTQDAIRPLILRREGSTSYSFDSGPVRFIVISCTSARQQITPEALAFLRAELARVPRGRPVVVATHYCFHAIANRDELVDAFGESNVVLVLGGHWHHAAATAYRGRKFLCIPTAQNGLFTVVRVKDGVPRWFVYDPRKRQ